MSFGKIVRKIVKKLLKRDTEPAAPEPSIVSGLYEDPNLDRLSTEPCTFCAEPDGACSGDLNRNVHLSDATGFTGSYDGGHRKCVEYGFADLSSPFATELAERDSACRSSRAPAPVCVCETCYIFRSPNLPSAISKSPRIAAPATVAAGQHIADGVAGEEFCLYRQCDVSVDSRVACGKFLKSGVTPLSEMEDCGVGGCRKSSVSLTSNTRQIHSASDEKQHLAGNTEQQQQPLPETYLSPTADLPVSVALSLDGEEGYARSQRHLRGRNRNRLYYCDDASSSAAQIRFHPPPNRTICHVTECRNHNVVS